MNGVMNKAVAVTSSPATSRWVVLTVMCTGYFLVLLDVTVVNVALPRIGSGLGSGVVGLQWVVDGYSLGLAALLLAGGTIGDLRGHKPVVLLGMSLFGLASLGCGLASSTGALIGARVVQGIGAALLLPGTLAIISRTFPERGEQARVIGVWAAVGSVALPVGPLLGGLVVQVAGWRWVFLLNIPIVLAAGAVTVLTVRPDAVRCRGKLDRAGVALGGLTLACATFAVIEAGHSGVDTPTVVAGAVAVLAFGGFLRVERTATRPMLPLQLARRPAFGTANAVAAAMNFGTLGLLFLVTLFLQTVQRRSALAAGAAVLPLFLPLTVLAPLAGRVTGRAGPRPVMVFGLVLAAGGVAGLAMWSPGTPYPLLVPAMLAWGIGLGALTPAVVAAAIGAAPPGRSGLVSGVNNTARQAGGAMGVAVYGAIAGQADHPGHFLTGLHLAGLLTAGLFLAAAVVTTAVLRSADGDTQLTGEQPTAPSVVRNGDEVSASRSADQLP